MSENEKKSNQPKMILITDCRKCGKYFPCNRPHNNTFTLEEFTIECLTCQEPFKTYCKEFKVCVNCYFNIRDNRL